ncbi:MAG: serine/threonine protein kinase [Deltaproteobacteria bacterium]|nr:serine/threonine protein kinase [Deltaproteobacteria bacterium]
MSLKEGDIIHQRYRLLRLIGTGTSGAVWAARNELIDREVALKMLEPEVMSDKVLLTRFFNEAKAIGRVKHPSIVGIFDLGQAEDGSPFLVLELLDGEPLSTRIQRDGPVEPETLFDVVSGVAKALDLAHQQGIVHRDLKPANIFLHRTSTGSLIGKILDFGISKVLTGGATNFALTKTGTVVGSPAYMSPEQAAGRDDLDGRADVWSAGVVLYEALTGALPHEAANYNALMVRILTSDVDPIQKRRPDLPSVVTDVVNLCLQRDREKRPTAGQLSAMLEAGTRTLRAERFKRDGGRRHDDAPPGAGFLDLPLLPRQQLRLLLIGAGTGVVTGTALGMLAYHYLLR